MTLALFGQREDGKTWLYHWDGETRAPFTAEEMAADAARTLARTERIWAEVLNKAFEHTT